MKIRLRINLPFWERMIWTVATIGFVVFLYFLLTPLVLRGEVSLWIILGPLLAVVIPLVGVWSEVDELTIQQSTPQRVSGILLLHAAKYLSPNDSLEALQIAKNSIEEGIATCSMIEDRW